MISINDKRGRVSPVNSSGTLCFRLYGSVIRAIHSVFYDYERFVVGRRLLLPFPTRVQRSTVIVGGHFWRLMKCTSQALLRLTYYISRNNAYFAFTTLTRPSFMSLTLSKSWQYKKNSFSLSLFALYFFHFFFTYTENIIIRIDRGGGGEEMDETKYTKCTNKICKTRSKFRDNIKWCYYHYTLFRTVN